MQCSTGAGAGLSLTQFPYSTLLRGELKARCGATDVEERHGQVVDRVLFLRWTRLKSSPDGSRRAYSLAEIASGAGTGAQWLDKMIRAGKAPNLDHAAGIAEFFGEKLEFLVDPRAEALARFPGRPTRTFWSAPSSGRTRISPASRTPFLPPSARTPN